MRVLDVGTSDGLFPGWAQDAGFSVTVSDQSPSGIGRLKERGFQALLLDLENPSPEFEFEFGTHDVLTALDVIEHVVDLVIALRTMNQCLRPQGRLFLSTPNFNNILDLWVYAGGKAATFHHNPNHVRFFIAPTKRWLMERQGFEVVRWHVDLPGEGRKGPLVRPLLPQAAWNYLSWRYGRHVIMEAKKMRASIDESWIPARRAYCQEFRC